MRVGSDLSALNSGRYIRKIQRRKRTWSNSHPSRFPGRLIFQGRCTRWSCRCSSLCS